MVHRQEPNSIQVQAATEVISTVEAVNYFVDAIAEITSGPLLEKAIQFAEFLRLREYSSEAGWSGRALPDGDFQSYVEGKAAESAKLFQPGEIKLEYAISKLAEFLRGYSQEGKPLDEQMADAMDKLFNAWLSKNGMICQGGIIYERTPDGQIKTDANGEQVRAKVQTLREKIAIQGSGNFPQFVKDKRPGLVIQILPERSFPAAPEAGPNAPESGPDTGPVSKVSEDLSQNGQIIDPRADSASGQGRV